PDGFTCECGSDSFEKEYDILDVWFDSGVSHFAVLDARDDLRWPADLYLEGSDQHRGWFQSSLWPALALRQRAPYDTVLTHGFMLDDQGRAMSKSLGNVIPPEDIIDKFGADILRLWVASEDYRNDVRIGYDMIQQIADSYRKIRNTFKFMIGNLSDFTATDCVLYEELSNIDTWILHKVSVLSDQVRQHYEHYEFHLVYRKIVNFCTVDLSALYFDISKDILYVEAKDAKIRRANQTVLYYVIQILLRLIAPILVFTAEEIWQFMGNDGSVHVDSYCEPQQEWYNDAVAKTMDILVDIKKDVLKALEIARKDKMIGSSLEADVHLYIPGASTRELVESIPDSKRFFQVADVYLESEKSSTMADYENSSIAITRSTGKKCSRCWNYSHNIGTHPAHPELCQRCTDIVLKLDR
ncbi:MAG TPA: class I tRNA ligase family protein, partial [Spirochaetota bacterium]|nr:class I tRNA ligase family protein [Spirochaetota bacterium]